MDESEENISSEDMKDSSVTSVKPKPKKRSLVERELETSLTARVTSPLTNSDGASTSRYGRTRRLKTDTDYCDTDKAVTSVLKSPKYEKTPIKTSPVVYKMHASNSPVRTDGTKATTPNSLDSQIESIYNTNMSLSRFGSEEKGSPAKKFTKTYIRKDLIQSKEKEIEDTVTLIKDIFSPEKSHKSNSNIVLDRSTDKYCNGIASKSQNAHMENLAVVKILDFDGNKRKKDNRETRVLSKSELFDLEAKCQYQVGDVSWARMGTYPFWPCIITRDPYSDMFVKKKLFGLKERDVLHVTFLGDNGRRSWILDSMLRPFLGREEFEAARDQFTAEAKKKDPRLYAAFFISDKKQSLWMKSVEEANTLSKEPKRLRIDLLNEMLGRTKTRQTPKNHKSEKICRTDSDVSLSESLYDTLFSEDDGKLEEEKIRSKINKSLDVSDVVTACLDNMAAKTGLTMIQRQSHMDIWLQKAKSKTPEKSNLITTITVEKLDEKGMRLLESAPKGKEKGSDSGKEHRRKDSKKKKRVIERVSSNKPYTLRKSTNESQNLLSHHNEHDYSSKIDEKSEDSESNSQCEGSLKHSGNETDLSSTTNNDSQVNEIESLKLEVNMTVTQEDNAVMDMNVVQSDANMSAHLINDTDKPTVENTENVIENYSSEILNCTDVDNTANDVESPDCMSAMEIDAVDVSQSYDIQSVNDVVHRLESNDGNLSEQNNMSIDENVEKQISQENITTEQSSNVEIIAYRIKQESTDIKIKNKLTNKLSDKSVKPKRSSTRRSTKIDQIIENADFQPKEFRIVIDKTDISKYEFKTDAALIIRNQKCDLSNFIHKGAVEEDFDNLPKANNGDNNLPPCDKSSDILADIADTKQDLEKKDVTSANKSNSELLVVNTIVTAVTERENNISAENNTDIVTVVEVSCNVAHRNDEMPTASDGSNALVDENVDLTTAIEVKSRELVENADIATLADDNHHNANENTDTITVEEINDHSGNENDCQSIEKDYPHSENENKAAISQSDTVVNTDIPEVFTNIEDKTDIPVISSTRINIETNDNSDKTSVSNNYEQHVPESDSLISTDDLEVCSEFFSPNNTNNIPIVNEEELDSIPSETNGDDNNLECDQYEDSPVEMTPDNISEVSSAKLDFDIDETVNGKRRLIRDFVESNVTESEEIDNLMPGASNIIVTKCISLAYGPTAPVVNGYHRSVASARIKELLDSDTASMTSDLEDVPLDELKRRTSKIDENFDCTPINDSFKTDRATKKFNLHLRSSQSPSLKENSYAESLESSVDIVAKKEVDPDTISINSEDSTASTKRRGRKDNSEDKMKNPDFLRYLEMRQDALIDENPELTDDEIASYLYKTWLYEENLKSDVKKSDELEQSNLVKGLGNDNIKPKKVKKPKASKSKLIDIEKVMSKENKIEGSLGDILREKPRRKTAQHYYNENLSDIEDEPEVFEIFKKKSKETKKPTEVVKPEDSNTENVEVPSPAVNEETTVEDIPEEDYFDQEEAYFEQLTLPKPNIFKGLAREKVCEICEKTSNLVKCKGCNGMFHVDCVKKQTDVIESSGPSRGRKKKKKPRGRRPKNYIDEIDSEHSDERSQDLNVSEENNMSIEEIQEQENLVVDAEKFESQLEVKMQELLKAELKYDIFLSDNDINWDKCVAGKCEIVDIKVRPKIVDTTDYSDFKCKHCQNNDTPLCFVCKAVVSPKEQIKHRQKCQFVHCNKYYHMECLDHWPQTQFSSGDSSKNRKNPTAVNETVTCPRHVCHTCVCDDPRGCKTRFSGDKLAKCVKCPATYHSFTKCLPAGTKILSASHIICPRHYEHRPGKVPCHVNTGWCFICALGGSLICCEYCPTSFHAECLNIKPPEGGYMCEDCETGRLPLYGEMVWVKLGHYRWWPGIILHPSEIPENIMAVKHSLGEFVVRFFGQYDHYWVNRGRVFPFQEGDSGRISSQKSKIDEAFTKAMEHAHRAFEILKNTEPNEEENMDIQSSLLPPHYVKLKVNRPCGSLYGKRIDVEESSLSQCECDPDVEDPCGPYSHCLNRMLLTECGPVCRAGERCNNRAFEKRQYPAMAPYRTPHRGWGLHALEDIKQGQFVIEYVGELIDEEEFQRRMRRKHEIRDENFYFLTLDKERMIDAGPKGNLARFMNHCCEPNCETQKWTVLGDVRVGLFALRDIPAQSELTFNYNLECAGIEKKRCLCGARRCAGYIGAKPKQEEPQVRKAKLQSKRAYKKRKNAESPSTSEIAKLKRPVGRPAKPRELTEIEKDLLIIKNATNGISSDSECSGRLSSIDAESERKDKRALKRKRVSFSSEDVMTCDSSSPSLKRVKLDDDAEVGD